MSKTYYEKVGNRYKPVSEYDPEFTDSLPWGFHLIHSRPRGQSRAFHVNPHTVAMTAASILAKETLVNALNKAVMFKPKTMPITSEQQDAWNKFIDVMGEDGRVLSGVSMYDIAEAGAKSLEEETEKLLQHEAVKQAYEHFMFVARLCYENKDTEKS